MASGERTALYAGLGTRAAAHRRAGFSLTEILIAIGVLGVGLVMVMAVFPAAIAQNKDSTADVLGTMICENVLAIAKTELRIAHVAGTGTFIPNQSLPSLSGMELAYPANDPNSYRDVNNSNQYGDPNWAPRGSLVLARELTTPNGRTDYQLLIVAYQKVDQNNQVKAVALTGATVPANSQFLTVPDGQANNLKIGSPVIDPQTGAYANIVEWSGSAGSNRTVMLSHAMAQAVSNPLVIVEADRTGPGNPIDSIHASPAMHVLIARTALMRP